MKSDGFVLILCLCFIALVSSMALSALLIGLLSQKIGIAGQQQAQQQQWAKALHLQEIVIVIIEFQRFIVINGWAPKILKRINRLPLVQILI